MTTRRAPAFIIPRAFPGITPAEIEELITNSKVRNYPPGTVLCRENAVENVFYMILEGEVEVTKVINNDQNRLLKVLRAGDFFGEMALIHNAPRAATVTTLTDLVVLELDKPAFERVLEKSSSVSLAMVREISNRLRDNDEMAIEDLRLRARELAAAYQKLAEQEVTRREFLTTMAHELRTPLMSAGGYLQLLQNRALSGPALETAMDTVARNVQQIVTLVNDILFLQEIELVLPAFQPVDLGALAASVVEKYQEKAQKQRVRLGLKTERNLPAAHGDAKSLERAVMALVDNAVKFSPNGGEVDVRLWSDRGRVCLSVSDHGIGIAPEALPHIFDRFYKTPDSPGSGLGLAIARDLVRAHGGEIQAESQAGRGTRLWFSLPLEP